MYSFLTWPKVAILSSIIGLSHLIRTQSSGRVLLLGPSLDENDAVCIKIGHCRCYSTEVNDTETFFIAMGTNPRVSLQEKIFVSIRIFLTQHTYAVFDIDTMRQLFLAEAQVPARIY